MDRKTLQLYIDGVSPSAGQETVDTAFWMAFESGNFNVAKLIATKLLERDLDETEREAWINRPDLADALQKDFPFDFDFYDDFYDD